MFSTLSYPPRNTYNPSPNPNPNSNPNSNSTPNPNPNPLRIISRCLSLGLIDQLVDTMNKNVYEVRVRVRSRVRVRFRRRVIPNNFNPKTS
jgi:hypothetical protein